MIRAGYDPRAHSLQVRGHAGSGEPGHDLICAGVSALVLALREELLHLEAAGEGKILSLRLEPGDAELLWEPAPGKEAAAAAFDTVLRGLRLLERLFGEYVEVRNGV